VPIYSAVRLRLIALPLLIVSLTACQATSGSSRAPKPTPAPSSTTSTPSPVLTTHRLIAGARWLSTPLGFRLQVRPTGYGRLHAWSAPSRALAEALRASRPLPLRLSATVRHSLRTQLLCHADFAPRKPFWDLETWRPDVGFRQTVLQLCNP